MGVDAGVQVLIGVRCEGPETYRSKIRVNKRCDCGSEGDKTKFCPECGASFGKDVDGGYDLSPLSAELQEAFEEEFEQWGVDAFGEGNICDSEGFGLFQLSTYNGDGGWVLGAKVIEFTSWGREETGLTSGSSMADMIAMVTKKMPQYGRDPGEVQIFHHLNFS